jgi:hypothetical protein
MGESNCPFLGVKTMLFCKAHPTVLVPLNGSLSAGSICTGEHHRECPSFQEINSPTSTSKPVEEGESHGTLTCSANVGGVCSSGNPKVLYTEDDS